MSDFLKIGGKYESGGTATAKGIAVNADGKIEAVRHNEQELVSVLSSTEKRDTSTISFYRNDAVDLSEWTTCCLLVSNTLDVNATLRLYSQSNKSSSAYLKDADGAAYTITIPHTSGEIIITPDDFPILSYLRYFSGGLYFDSTPTSGSISLSVLRKR